MSRDCRRLVLAAWLAADALGVAGAAPSDTVLADCAAQALPRSSMTQVQRVRVEGAGGWVRESLRRVYFKRTGADETRLLVILDEPRQEAGLKVLVIKQADTRPEVWVYSPDMRRARRMVGAGASSSALGSDFTAADAEHLAGFLVGDDVRVLGDTTHAGRAAVLLEAPVAASDTGYVRIRVTLDRAWCVPLRAVFIGADGAPVKSLEAPATRVSAVAGRHVPMETVVIDAKSGNRTTVTLDAVEIDVPLADALFAPQSLEQAQ